MLFYYYCLLLIISSVVMVTVGLLTQLMSNHYNLVITSALSFFDLLILSLIASIIYHLTRNLTYSVMRKIGYHAKPKLRKFIPAVGRNLRGPIFVKNDEHYHQVFKRNSFIKTMCYRLLITILHGLNIFIFLATNYFMIIRYSKQSWLIFLVMLLSFFIFILIVSYAKRMITIIMTRCFNAKVLLIEHEDPILF